jgi:hypothetical protein
VLFNANSAINHIGGVMVSVLASSAIYHVFKPRSGKTKHNKIGISLFRSIKEKKQRMVGLEKIFLWINTNRKNESNLIW